jgi:hypothetical protein
MMKTIPILPIPHSKHQMATKETTNRPESYWCFLFERLLPTTSNFVLHPLMFNIPCYCSDIAGKRKRRFVSCEER